MHPAKLLEQPVAYATTREPGVGVRRILAPVESAPAAVGGRLIPRHTEQGTDQPAVACGHSEQGTPPGGRGEPVEHGLRLV